MVFLHAATQSGEVLCDTLHTKWWGIMWYFYTQPHQVLRYYVIPCHTECWGIMWYPTHKVVRYCDTLPHKVVRYNVIPSTQSGEVLCDTLQTKWWGRGEILCDTLQKVCPSVFLSWQFSDDNLRTDQWFFFKTLHSCLVP